MAEETRQRMPEAPSGAAALYFGRAVHAHAAQSDPRFLRRAMKEIRVELEMRWNLETRELGRQTHVRQFLSA